MHADDTNYTVIKNGVVVVSGTGPAIRVDGNQLVIRDGPLETPPLCLTRAQASRKLHHVVVCGHAGGFVTFDALRWLRDTGVAFSQFDWDGSIIMASGPRGPDRPAFRRAQALVCSGVIPKATVAITREILRVKLNGQAEVARLMRSADVSAEIHRLSARLAREADGSKVLSIEAHAASIYWKLWKDVPGLRPRAADLARDRNESCDSLLAERGLEATHSKDDEASGCGACDRRWPHQTGELDRPPRQRGATDDDSAASPILGIVEKARQEPAYGPRAPQFVGGGRGKTISDLLVHVRKDIEETRRHLPLLRQSEGALENLKRGGVRLVEHRQPDPKNNANEQRRQRTQIIVTEAAEDRSQRMAARQLCRPPQVRGDLRLYVTERLHFRSDRPELTERISEIGCDPHRFAF
jgi:hypothetical protein